MNPKRIHRELRIVGERAGVFLPAHDTDIDLFAIKERKQVGIQVKESRCFVRKGVIVSIEQSVASSSRGSELPRFPDHLPVVKEYAVDD